jgi:hypothetical protein
MASYKQQDYNSKYAQHLVENDHPMAPINETMEVVQVVKKGHYMNALQRFYVYEETHRNNQLNEKPKAGYNRLFVTIIHWNNSDSAKLAEATGSHSVQQQWTEPAIGNICNRISVSTLAED